MLLLNKQHNGYHLEGCQWPRQNLLAHSSAMDEFVHRCTLCRCTNIWTTGICPMVEEANSQETELPDNSGCSAKLASAKLSWYKAPQAVVIGCRNLEEPSRQRAAELRCCHARTATGHQQLLIPAQGHHNRHSMSPQPFSRLHMKAGQLRTFAVSLQRRPVVVPQGPDAARGPCTRGMQ